MFQLVDQMPIENREKWVSWRESLAKSTVFGSQFPSWFSEGYVSMSRLHDEVHGLKEKPNISLFQELAMEHGTLYEKEALDLALREIVKENCRRATDENDNYFLEFRYVHGSEDRSALMRHKDRPDVQLVISPDAILLVSNALTGNQSVAVVEAKCPFHESSKFDSVSEWTASFKQRHPAGYLKAFWQAALYAAVDINCTEFFTAFYFVHSQTNMRQLLLHGFKMTEELREFVLTEAENMSNCLGDEKFPRNKLRASMKRNRKIAPEFVEKAHYLFLETEPEFITFDNSDKENSPESG